jgi:riboflavin synthase
VDGVSLTVAEIDGDEVTIGLIPETLERTALGVRAVGEGVNVEVDVLAKYVEKLTAGLLPGAAGAQGATAATAPAAATATTGSSAATGPTGTERVR